MSDILQETFREELQELLADLEGGLLKLEESPSDSESVNRVFRALHTIKGSGALAGFDRLAGFTHHVEALFEDVRSGSIEVSSVLIDLTLQAQDTIQALAADEDSVSQQDIASLVEHLGGLQVDINDAVVSEEETARDDMPATVGSHSTFWVRFRPPVDVFERGLDPANLVRELTRMGDARVSAGYDAPASFEDFEPTACHVVWNILLTTAQSTIDIQDLFIFVEDESELGIELLDDSGRLNLEQAWQAWLPLFEAGKKPTAEDVNSIIAQNDEPVPEHNGPERRSMTPDRRQAATDRRQESGSGDDAARVAASVRVRSERLDKLVDLIGELVTVQARLKQVSTTISDVDLERISEEVEQLTWELRDEVLSIRMVPIGSTFNRFARQVRDLARELGKDVQLLTSGGDTELDKTVIERLSDPVLHLLRNAIDHGLELPEQRSAAGKPVKGSIRLSAFQSGASVLVEVRDDGRGLNYDWIRERAEEKGMLQPGEDFNQVGVWELISSAGFSTSEAITSISGRGVGLDVVRKAIEDLRGTVEVESSSGEGTCFRVKLPLTLAIIDGLLVRIGRERFVMPLAQVEEIIEQNRTDVERQHGRDLLHIRDEIVPYLHLRREFGINGQIPEIEQVIIANLDGFRLGFAVDEVIGEHQTVIKSLGRMYRDIPGLSGATVLGDGSLALILDLPALMRLEESRSRQDGNLVPVTTQTFS